MLAESAAITLIFCRGSLFLRVRALWPAFLGCPLCVGQWVGSACAAWLGERDPVVILGAGSAAGVLAFGIHQVLDLLAAVEKRLE